MLFGVATSVCRFWFDRSLVGENRVSAPCFLVWLLVCLFSFSGGLYGEELLVSLLFYMAPSLSPFWFGERIAGEERACYIGVSCDSKCVSFLVWWRACYCKEGLAFLCGS